MKTSMNAGGGVGLWVDENLEFDKHIKTIVNRANRMLGMIKIGFTSLDMEIFMNLYPVLVRPLLEYCVQVWSPHKQKYIKLIEGVQERAVRMVPVLGNLDYDGKLKRLHLTRLVERRFRGEMIETFKLPTNNEGLNPDIFFEKNKLKGVILNYTEEM